MAQHSEPIQAGMSDPMERSGRTVARRPGILTFAAVIMFMVAGFEVLAALFAFAGSGWWVTDMGNLVYTNFVLWGIVDSVIALIALYAGIDLLRGGSFGRGMAYVFAVVGAIRWLFVLPAAPILAVVIIALCVMVIYALSKDSDYVEA
jgi:hypothetical protein